jgi:citrate lyase subunit beta/citryl-CoA lyase
MTTSIDDMDTIRDDIQHASDLGFGGKLCIHPKQIACVNEEFAPSGSEFAWAMRMMAAASAANGTALALDGKMVDLRVISIAQRMLSEPERQAFR